MWEQIFKQKRCHVKVEFKAFPIRMKVTSRAEPPPGSASARARWRWSWAPSPPPGWCSGQCSPPPAAPGEEEKSCFTPGVHHEWEETMEESSALSGSSVFDGAAQVWPPKLQTASHFSVTVNSPSRTSRSQSPSGTADCGGLPQGTWGAGLGDKNCRGSWI